MVSRSMAPWSTGRLLGAKTVPIAVHDQWYRPGMRPRRRLFGLGPMLVVGTDLRGKHAGACCPLPVITLEGE